MVTTTPTEDRASTIAHSTIDSGSGGNDQFTPQVVALDDGRYVVLWTDNSDEAPGAANGTDILAQVFDPFGVAIGTPQLVNLFNVDDEGEFSVAALPGGKFVVAYEDTDGSGTSIRAQEITVDDDGTWDTNVTRTILLDPGANELGDPAVSTNPDGSYIVTYGETEAGVSTNFRAKIVSPTGVVGSQFNLLSGSSDVGVEQNAATTLNNGNYVTVSNFLSTGDDRIAFRIVDKDGANVKGFTSVNTTNSNSQSDTDPAVAALTGGGFVIVWVNNDGTDTDVKFQRYNADGSTAGSETLVNGGAITDNNNEARVVALNDGGFFIVYDDDSDDAIKGQRYDSTGGSVGSEVTIADTAGTESQPAVTLTDDGRILIAWTVNNAGNNDARFAVYDPRDEVIDGDHTDNVILGRVGDDTTINGNNGNDELWGRDGNDTINGGGLDDTINGGSGDDSLRGGSGNDLIVSDTGNDTIDGGTGDDTLTVDSSTTDLIEGGAGIDTIDESGVIGGGTLYWDLNNGYTGSSSFSDPVIIAISGVENYIGFEGSADFVRGTADANVLEGLSGNDNLQGNDGNDTLEGGAGNDTLNGGKDDDRLFGGDNDDNLSGFTGNDTLAGQSGDDTVGGGGGDDKVFGNGGNDRVNGGSGDDTLTGSAGMDTLNGGNGNDDMFGNGDGDRMIGDSGNDNIVGLGGDDTLFGGQGADTLKGGTGNDVMSAGADADRFVFEANTDDDIVNGFSSAQGDVIELKGIAGFNVFSDVTSNAMQSGNDVVIDLGGGDSVTLVDVNLASLSAGDFLFT